MIAVDNCKIEGCRKPRLSFSETCLEHAENKNDLYNKIFSHFSNTERIQDICCNEMIFENYSFSKKIFHSSCFQHCIFKDVDFSNTSFRICFFDFCTFENCNLTQTNIQFTTFAGSQFKNVNFENSDLIHSNFNDII